MKHALARRGLVLFLNSSFIFFPARVAEHSRKAFIMAALNILEIFYKIHLFFRKGRSSALTVPLN